MQAEEGIPAGQDRAEALLVLAKILRYDAGQWSLDGTWEQILGRLQAGCDATEGADWTVSADSTVVRAHQHAAGARRAIPADGDKGGGIE